MCLAPAQFDFIAGLRSVWRDIREEYLALPQESATKTRTWSEGDVLVFDDTTEHEAWNRSDQTRTVLLFDFLRPGHEKSAPDETPTEVREFIQQRTRRAPGTS